MEDPYVVAQEHFDNGNCVFSLFNHPKSSRGKRGPKSSDHHSTYLHPSNSFDPAQFISNIVGLKKNGHTFKRVLFAGINKLSKTNVFSLEKYNTSKSKDITISIHTVVTDMCRHNISKMMVLQEKKKSNFIVFTYTNRYLEEINLNQICNSMDVKTLYIRYVK